MPVTVLSLAILVALVVLVVFFLALSAELVGAHLGLLWARLDRPMSLGPNEEKGEE